ncbi:MAG: APC family permease [Vicinamibacterales bacterium]
MASRADGGSPAETAAELRGRIGVAGGVSTIVGYIIGGSIFILPVTLAGQVGPGIFLSYLIAAAIALFVCMVSAQIGSAFPMSGGTYVAVSSVVSPFWGFMVVWMGVLIAFTSTSALAYGLVDHLVPYVPALAAHRLAGAIASIAIFTGVNLLGIRTAVWVQTVLVVVFMAVLVVVGAAGLAHGSLDRFTPLFPIGMGPVLYAAIPAYYSYSGFSAIVTIGGEIVEPRRNIPRVLGVSFPVIALTYTLLTVAVPAAVPWQELRTGEATLTRVASAVLPPGVELFVGAAALCAIATSINGLLLAKSRDVFSLALDRVLPRRLAGVGPFGEPRTSLFFMGSVAICGVLLQRSFAEYAAMSVLCVMVVHALQGIVVLRLPQRRPAHFAAAGYRFGAAARWFWGTGLVLSAVGFILIGLEGDRVGGVIYLLACGLGAAWYVRRRQTLRQEGIDIDVLLLAHAAHAVPHPPPPLARAALNA